VYIGSHGHDNLDNYNLILPSTTYLEKESTYMNLTGLIQKSGSLVSALPNIRNASDIINMFLIYVSKQGQADSFLKSVNQLSNSQTKILNNKNSMHDISGIDLHVETVEKIGFNKI
jgi:anaerobic selenocysteine-containing dehydrogenase